MLNERILKAIIDLPKRIPHVLDEPDSNEYLKRANINFELFLNSVIVSTFAMFTQKPDLAMLSWAYVIGTGAYSFYQEKKSRQLREIASINTSKDFVHRYSNDGQIDLNDGVLELGRVCNTAIRYGVSFRHLLGDSMKFFDVQPDFPHYVWESGMRYRFSILNVLMTWENKYSNPEKREQFKNFLRKFSETVSQNEQNIDFVSLVHQMHKDLGLPTDYFDHSNYGNSRPTFYDPSYEPSITKQAIVHQLSNDNFLIQDGEIITKDEYFKHYSDNDSTS